MATNFFFNNFRNSQEQLLIESLIVESIKIYGMDMVYLPKTVVDYDPVYGEAPASRFVRAYPIEMYIRNIDSFEGDGTFLSKFNLEIRDQVTFTLARKAFFDETIANALERPNEGDLIYFPLNNKIFEIKYVKNDAIFYQLGALQTWDLKCELFEYSNELFETGIEEIDVLSRKYSLSMVNMGLLAEEPLSDVDLRYPWITDESGFPVVQEAHDIDAGVMDPFADNDEIQEEADDFLDFSERDPFSDGGTY